MSRRYPVIKEACEVCGVSRAASKSGAERPHTCWVQWSGEPTPWPSMPSRSAARRLGVDPQVLEGLMNSNGKIRGVKVVRLCDVGQSHAEARYMLNREDVLALEAVLQSKLLTSR